LDFKDLMWCNLIQLSSSSPCFTPATCWSPGSFNPKAKGHMHLWEISPPDEPFDACLAQLHMYFCIHLYRMESIPVWPFRSSLKSVLYLNSFHPQKGSCLISPNSTYIQKLCSPGVKNKTNISSKPKSACLPTLNLFLQLENLHLMAYFRGCCTGR
jgi:hypothetical protein